jgi:hypothetical protein
MIRLKRFKIRLGDFVTLKRRSIQGQWQHSSHLIAKKIMRDVSIIWKQHPLPFWIGQFMTPRIRLALNFLMIGK